MSERRRKACWFGESLVVCTITEESLAASLGVNFERVKARLAKRKSQRQQAREIRREEMIARVFAKAVRDADIRHVAKAQGSLRALALRFGLSHERIRQILRAQASGAREGTG